MKKFTTLSHTPLLVSAAGLVGAIARSALYLLGKDSSGLLTACHPLHLLCWVLTAAVALCLWAVLRKLAPINDYSANFPTNNRVLPASILVAAGIAITVLTDLNPRDRLALTRTVLGLLSAAALVTIGVGRAADKRPKFYLYGALCLFYAIHMICRYKVWSGNPQVADYCFSLLACACLTISAYQRAAFCAGVGHRRVHLFFCLMAGFFCVLCAPGEDHSLLYLTSGCFFLTDLAMTVPHPRQGGK